MKLQYFVALVILVVYGTNGQTNNNTQEGSSDLIRTLKDGQIRGKQHLSSNLKKTYFSFEGIPFARPPLGSLRFQPPVSNEPWSGILDATHNKSSCVQQSGVGSEDCLYINVYTPSLNKTSIPVIFWIYGGAFTSNDGSTATGDPEYLVEENVIYVSFNYRLDIFGFLSTGDLVAPGNVGLKDQALALKWVRDNIASFGGDPQKVTLFGESAGAVSVSLMMQSPLTKNMFRAAIMDSGTSLNLWGLARTARKVAFEVGEKLGVDTTNSSTLVAGLRQVDAKTLIKQSQKVYINEATTGNILAGLPYAPVIEPAHPGAYFTNKSHELLRQGNFTRVPVLLGYNSQEAIIGDTLPGVAKLLLEKFNLLPANLIPTDMGVSNFLDKIFLGGKIKLTYFGLDLVLGSNNDIVKFVNDDQFIRPIQEAGKLHSKFVPTYFYVFSYDGRLGMSFNRSLPGVGHAEELNYLFKTNKTGVPAQDWLTRNRMVKMWTNFVKYTNPTPVRDSLLNNVTWLPLNIINDDYLVYLNISASPSLNINPNAEKMAYWKNLYSKYGNPPYDTY